MSLRGLGRHPCLQRGRRRSSRSSTGSSRRSSSTCEVLVVVDFDEDTTVPVLQRVRRSDEPRLQTAGQHLRPRTGQRDPLRHRPRPARRRGRDDGRRQRRPAPDRRPGAARRARRRRRRRLALLPRRPAGRRAVLKGMLSRIGRACRWAGSARVGTQRRDQQLQGLLDRLHPRGRHRQPQRLRDRPGAHRQGPPPAAARSPRSRPSGSTAPPASPTST